MTERGNRLALLSRVLGAIRAAAADAEDERAPAPYTPICPNCQQEGREHTHMLEPGRHFICVVCDTRWMVQAPES
jgi:hypothetical protein